MFNELWGQACGILGGTLGMSLKKVDTLHELLGYINAPFAYLMGIPTCDILKPVNCSASIPCSMNSSPTHISARSWTRRKSLMEPSWSFRNAAPFS